MHAHVFIALLLLYALSRISLGSAPQYVLTLNQPSKDATLLLITRRLKPCCN